MCLHNTVYFGISAFFRPIRFSFSQQVNAVKIAKCTYNHLFIMVLRCIVATFLLHFCELPKI